MASLDHTNASVISDFVNVLRHTMSQDKTTRSAAEAHLINVEATPGFARVVLTVVQSASVEGPLRQLAAVVFKNFIKRCWFFDLEEGIASRIADADRHAVKSSLVALMCQVPAPVQRQLSRSLTIISNTDFPNKWPELLPELVSKLNDSNMDTVNGVLEAANSIFKRFRGAEATDENCLALKAALDVFQEPLLKMYETISTAVGANQGNKAVLLPLFKALRTMSRIFYSLNWITIPAFFEDNLKQWMGMFRTFLMYRNPILVDPDETEETGPVEILQAAILDNVAIYAEKYDEEFQEFFPDVVGAVWQLLVGWGAQGMQRKYDLIISTAMKFLAGVVGRELHRDVFKSPETLDQICRTVSIPNMAARETEEELFEGNPVDYIRRDLEGSNSDTRRRAASDLIKGLCQTFDAEVSAICLRSVEEMFKAHAANVADWRPKDAALTLLIALAVRKETRARGVSEVNPRVNVLDIAQKVVLPELGAADVNANGILIATCLKFLMTFRNQLDPQTLGAMVPAVARFLTCKHYVVHSYAAILLDRVFAVKLAGAAAVPAEVVTAQLPTVVAGLLNIMITPNYPENEYLMKALMRVVSGGGAAMLPLAGEVLTKLTHVLGLVTANPSQPVFNHYLFETLAALLKAVCAASPGPDAVNKFEAMLFPPFQVVLSKEVSEFLPYVFQILALLLELRPPPAPNAEVTLSPAYQALLKALMKVELWDARGNIPALVTLLMVYLHKCPTQVVASGTHMPILGVFQKLVAARFSEDSAFKLLSSVLLHLPLSAFSGHLGDLYRVLGERMSRNKTPRFARHFVHTLCLVVAKHGVDAMVAPLEGLGPGTAVNILTHVVVPHAAKVPTALQRKAVAAGLTRLLTEWQPLYDNKPIWDATLSCTVATLEAKAVTATDGDADVDAQIEAVLEYSAGFSQLALAVIPAVDPLPSVPTPPRAFLASQLGAANGRLAGLGARVAAVSDVFPTVSKYMVDAGVRL